MIVFSVVGLCVFISIFLLFFLIFIFKNFLSIHVINIFLSEGKLSRESNGCSGLPVRREAHQVVPFNFP